MSIINPDIYNAALIGCASGIASGRTPKSTNFLDYQRISIAAVAFASAVDAVIPAIGGGATQAQIETMTELCKACFVGQYPSANVTAATYARLANAIKAEWTAITIQLSATGGAGVRIMAWGVCNNAGSAHWLSNVGFEDFGSDASHSQLVGTGEWRLRTNFDMGVAVGGVAIYVTPYGVAAAFPTVPLRADINADASGGQDIYVLTQSDPGGGFAAATLPVMITVIGNGQ